MNPTTTPTKEARTPGFTCPKCSFFIEMSIQSLLFGDSQKCPGCGVVYSMDRGKSKEALQLVQKLHVAMENLDSVKRFDNSRKPGIRPR